MPTDYIDSPATVRDDVSLAQVPALDFSIVQPFASPSKNPAEDLRNKMRGLRTGALQQPPLRTPRIRNALLDRRNPPAKQEFTPLLRSAKRREILRQSIIEEKENNMSSDMPEMPAEFRSSYMGGEATQLPIHSSMLEEDESSIGYGPSRALPAQSHAVSSSMLSATPVPTMHRSGEGVVLDQANVLSLRDQEAKLDQVQKDNFGLKLKIHFLEEALRKTGSEFHQATLKENAELKTEKMTTEADLKRQKKRMLALEQELFEYRQKYTERNGSHSALSKQHAEDMARLQRQADDAQRLAERRLHELEDMRDELGRAQEGQQASDEVQGLKEDIEDLEREVRDRDAQLDSKAEELQALQAKMRETASSSDDAEHLKQDVAELESELREKERQLDGKDEEITGLKDRLSSLSDRESSAKRTRLDVQDLETKLREREHALDEANEQLDSVRMSLKKTEAELANELEERDDEIEELQTKLEFFQAEQSSVKHREESLRAAQQEIIGKDGEIRALEERLLTARGSWDAEAQHHDARLQEKDRILQDRDSQLREKSVIIEQRDDELDNLQKRLRIAERRQEETTQAESGKVALLREQIRELEETARHHEHDSRRKLKEKDSMLEERSVELRQLQRRIDSMNSGSADIKSKLAEIDRLELNNRNLTNKLDEQVQLVQDLEGKLRSSETPSRRDLRQREHIRQVDALQASIQKLEKEKKAALDDLEIGLNRVEKENLRLKSESEQMVKLKSQVDELILDKEELQRKIDRASDRIREADGDQSMIGHQSDELSQSRAKILVLEDEVDELQSSIRRQQSLSRSEVEKLKEELNLAHVEARQALEDELMVLETALDEAEGQRQALTERVAKLEIEVKTAQQARETGTPARERNTLRSTLQDMQNERDQLRQQIEQHHSQADEMQSKLSHAERASASLQQQLDDLQREMVASREEKTLADERADLHELVKRAKIEAEELQIKLVEREKKLAASSKRESELRGQLDAAQVEIEDAQANMEMLESKMNAHMVREKELRAQVSQSRDAKHQMEELEMQLGDRNTSSSGHARREAELRVQLRDAKIGLESLQMELAEKEDRILTLMKREHGLRERIKRARHESDDTLQAHFDALQAQLAEADGDVEALQRQVQEREKLLAQAQKKELELRSKIKVLQQGAASMSDIDQQKRHQKEILGMRKQMDLFKDRCERERRFRKELISTKRWFLMQIAMYNECNQADLRLLEDMGITTDQTVREKRPTLRSAAYAIIAAQRIRRWSEDWESKKLSQQELVTKVDIMKKARKKAAV